MLSSEGMFRERNLGHYETGETDGGIRLLLGENERNLSRRGDAWKNLKQAVVIILVL